MMDKSLEAKIDQVRDFINEWVGFRDFLKGALKNGKVSPEEERKFLEIKSLIARKYQVLVQALGEGFSPDNRVTEIISQAVSLEGMVGTSGMKFTKIENDWHQTYIRLNELMGKLESEEYQVAGTSQASGLSGVGKGLLRGLIKLILIFVLLVILGLVGSYFFLAEEETKEKGFPSYIITTVKSWMEASIEEP